MISVDTGKGWFVDHLRELGPAPFAGASGADAFLEKLLENDWRSMVKSIPSLLRAEWTKALQLVLSWWWESFDEVRRAGREARGTDVRRALARMEAAECVWLALPALLLRKGAVRRKRRAAAAAERSPMGRRIASFLAGDWGALVEETYQFIRDDKDGRVERARAASQGPSTPEQGGDSSAASDTERARARFAAQVRARVFKQMQLGQYSRAFSALTPSRPAARTVETLGHLQKLHPRPADDGCEGSAFEEIDGVDMSVDTFSIGDLKKTIKSRPRGSAQDRWGWRVEFLAPLCRGAENRPALAMLRDYLQNMLNGGSSDAFSRVIGGAREAALQKNVHGDDNRNPVRPVGVPDLSRRVLGSTCVRKGSATFAAGLSGGAEGRAHQLAVGRSRGTQTAFFGVVEYLRLHPERVAIIKDVENAFNTVSTRAADEGLKRLDAQDKFGMRRFLRAFYSRVDELSYFLDDGTRQKVLRYDGPTQGCPGSGLFYSAAVYGPTVEALEEVGGDTVSLAYMDDDNLLGAPEEALRVAALQQAKFKKIGLHVRDYTILRGSEAPPADEIREAAERRGLFGGDGADTGPRLKIVDAGIDTGVTRSHDESPGTSPVVDEGVRVLGGPVGTPRYVPEYVAKEVKAHQQALVALEDFSRVNPHLGHALALYCADPRVHHLWMLVPQTAAGSAFEEAHNRILHIFQRSANLQLAGLTDTESNLVHSRLASPIVAGGFGFADPDILADAAWVASWVATAPWLRTVTGLDRVGKPRVPLEEGEVPQDGPNGEGPLWNAGRQTWNRLRERLDRALRRRMEQRDMAEALSLRAPRNDVRKRALEAAKAIVETVRKARDRFAGEFETITETVWPPRGVQRALAVILSAADADEVIDKVIRGVEDGAGPAHTGTRHSGRHQAEDVAPERAPVERDGRDAPDAFASPPRSPLTGRRRPRDEPSEDGPASRTRARARREDDTRASESERASDDAPTTPGQATQASAARRARAHAHAERAKAIVANAVACRGDGMQWLNHSPCYGVPMLTAEEWTTAVHFSLSVDRPEFTALARRKAKCACCVDKTHGDAAAWMAHALNVKTGRHGLSPSGLHHRIAMVVNKIALECGVNSTLGGDRTRCGTDASGQGVFSDVFLADLYPDQRGDGVHLDVTCGNVVKGDGTSNGDHKDPDYTINACLARKAKQYAPFVDKRVMTLAMNSGGRMSKDFHTVLHALARRKVSGDDGAGDAGEDADERIERRQHIAREKKRMISAIQAARIAYQARLIMATTAQGERQPGRFGARGSSAGPAGVI